MKTLPLFLCLAVTLGPAFAAEPTAAGPDGKDLYAKKCAMCHGASGVPTAMAKGSASFDDAEWQAKTTDEAIVQVTLAGKEKMPKFEGKLTPEEVKAIVTHIRTMKKAG